MNLNTGDAVEYIEYLLKAARGGSYLSAEDKNALKALSDVITDFLTASQSGADGSQKLLAELCRLGEKDSSETVTNARFSAPVFSIDLEGSSVPDLSAPIMTMTDTADVGPQKAPTDAKTANEIKVQFGKCLGSGGEGSVYKIPSMPGKVAKIYRSGKFCNLSERKTMERKLHALMKKRGAGKIDGVSIAALPDELLYNGDGELIGYIMPQVLGSLKIYGGSSGIARKIFPRFKLQRAYRHSVQFSRSRERSAQKQHHRRRYEPEQHRALSGRLRLPFGLRLLRHNRQRHRRTIPLHRRRRRNAGS